MSSKFKHVKFPPEVAELIEEYYQEYKKTWLEPVINDPIQTELNRYVTMGMTIMRDLLSTHYEKESFNVK